MDKNLNFKRISEAIDYIREHFREQPSLDEVARHVHLSAFHFQRLFTEWAGVSPKKFLQYSSIQYAKQLLMDQQTSLFDIAFKTGLSGTGRLHDLFISIEGMTPGEYKNGAKSLSINYYYFESPFGNMIVASTTKGICHMAFFENEQEAFMKLKTHFPNANYVKKLHPIQENALHIFTHEWSNLSQVKLHLKGSAFQLKIWETLLKIPFGQLSTYGNIAGNINNPNSSRAVGTAIGKNPVAFLIPCHRVIQSSGKIGGYMWGITRKTAMIGWEAAKTSEENQ